MRPPEFTGGNETTWSQRSTYTIPASMRPPEFTGGNPVASWASGCRTTPCFNEAAGIHRRKRQGLNAALQRVCELQ